MTMLSEQRVFPDLEETPSPATWPIQPVGWRILVKPVEAITTSTGGIQLASETVQAQEYLRNHGTVLAVGPLAYADSERFGNRPWCKPGDQVVFGRGAGIEMLLKDGSTLRLMNDDEILGIVTDENQLRRRM
jgi:co-chaperonin GroES (HSP10)